MFDCFLSLSLYLWVCQFVLFPFVCIVLPVLIVERKAGMPLLLVLAERCDVCVCTCVYVSLFQAVSPASCYTCVNCRDERRGASPLLPVFQERWPSVFLPPALPLSLYFSFHFPFSVFSMLPPLSAPPSFSLSPFIPCSQSPFHFSISLLPFSVFVTPSLAYESVPPSNTDKLSLFPDFLAAP